MTPRRRSTMPRPTSWMRRTTPMKIDVDRAPHLLERGFEQRLRDQYPGVVDEDVDRPRRLAPGLSTDSGIGLIEDMSLGAVPSAIRGKRLRPRCRPAPARTGCRGRGFRHRRAEAVCRAGHQDAPARESPGRSPGSRSILGSITQLRVAAAPSAIYVAGEKPRSRRAASMTSGPRPNVFQAGPPHPGRPPPRERLLDSVRRFPRGIVPRPGPIL